MRASACLTILLLFPLAKVWSAEPEKEPDTVYTAAREARDKEHFDKTRLLGSDAWDKPFEEIPADGAVLVGFDFGLGRRGNDDIYAVRAIFRNERGETFQHEFGLFSYVRDEEGRRSRVTHTSKVVARPGFAVGAITVRGGRQIHGMSVTFMRLKGLKLDPDVSYSSEWIGNRIGGREETISTNGSPVIGVYGNKDDREILGFGLITLPRAGESQAAEPPVKLADTSADADFMTWVPFVVFGVVAIPIFLVLWLSVGRKTKAAATADEHRVKDRDAVEDEAHLARQAERERRQRDPEYARQAELRAEYDALMQNNGSGSATTALTLGFISLIAWCLPIAGLPVSVAGLVIGFRALARDQSGKAMIGMILSGIGLFLSIGNAALGAFMAMQGKHFLMK